MKGGQVQTKLCQICEKCSSKYKCPSCYILYCSLACFKTHKDQICEIETNKRLSKLHNNKSKEVQMTGKDDYDDDSDDSEDEDRLSPNDLAKLGECDMVKGMLKNKDLRTILSGIDSAEDPPALLRNAMNEPIFTEFMDQCLGIVQPKQDKSDN